MMMSEVSASWTRLETGHDAGQAHSLQVDVFLEQGDQVARQLQQVLAGLGALLQRVEAHQVEVTTVDVLQDAAPLQALDDDAIATVALLGRFLDLGDGAGLVHLLGLGRFGDLVLLRGQEEIAAELA